MLQNTTSTPSGPGLMFLQHLPHGLPIIVTPALIDVFVVHFRDPAVPKGKPRATLHFFQGKSRLRIMPLGPVATPPGLDDPFVLDKIQIDPVNIPPVSSKLSADLSTDGGFLTRQQYFE